MDLLKRGLQDAGPTFIVEKLLELHNIQVSKETVRRWLIKNGFRSASRVPLQYRKRRERMECFGMMIQLDDSHHHWFEDGGPARTLLVSIDDATSELVWLEFVEGESTDALMQSTEKYISKFGRPVSFYVDFAGVFSVNINNKDRVKKTQFERALMELDIRLIHASSPQAKGRVERVNKTLQDRLVKEFTLAGISTIEGANAYVHEHYIKKHNEKFAKEAKSPHDAHRPLEGFDLKAIFCIKSKRVIQSDFTVMYKTRIFQILKNQRTFVNPKDKVIISESFDGTVIISIRNIQLSYTELSTRPVKKKKKPAAQKKVDQLPCKPKPDHPWRMGYSPLYNKIK